MGRSRVYCTRPANANRQHNASAARPIPEKPQVPSAATDAETARSARPRVLPLRLGDPTCASRRSGLVRTPARGDTARREGSTTTVQAMPADVRPPMASTAPTASVAPPMAAQVGDPLGQVPGPSRGAGARPPARCGLRCPADGSRYRSIAGRSASSSSSSPRVLAANADSRRSLELLRVSRPTRVHARAAVQRSVAVRVGRAQPRITWHRDASAVGSSTGTRSTALRRVSRDPLGTRGLGRRSSSPRGEHPRPVRGDGDGVLEVRGAGAVRGDAPSSRRPARGRAAGPGDHRLDRQRHARDEPRALARRP